MKDKIFKMICESAEPAQLIKEAYDPTKPQMMKYSGVFMVSDQRNGNDRIYPYEILKKEADRLISEMIDTGRCLSELEHPSNSEISPDRACARILSMREDNKTWVGEAVILRTDEKFGIKGTPCGDLLASLATYGTKFGVSSRALGEVGDDGIVTDLHLVTLDTVLNPSIGQMVTSDGNRLVNGILESKQWVCNIHGEMIEKRFNKFEKTMATQPNTFISSKKAEYVGKALNDFFTSLTR